MNLRHAPPYRSWRIPAGYRFLQRMVRLAAWLFYPKIRFLNKADLEPASPALLVVNYPESLCAALRLVAAADRPVLCLLTSQSLRGIFQKFVGRRLGIVPIDPRSGGGTEWPALFASALTNWKTLALFAGVSRIGGDRKTQGGGPVANLVFQTLQQRGKQPAPALYPIHAFLPPDRWKASLLVYVDAPIREAPPSPRPDVNSAEAPPPFALAARLAMQKNVFALEPVEIGRFHQDIEDVAHEDLAAEWAEVPEWRQQAEDLQLSGFVKRWIDEQNQIDPGRLVALRKLLEDYREARRRFALERLRVETSSLWQKSGMRIAAAWVESLLGLPVALYGVINHLFPGVILHLSGLRKNSANRDPKVEWLFRGFVVMGCYIFQVWLFDLWLGRAAAGYYTLTLPLSGAYLWRYLWLARNQSSVLLLKATLPARAARLRRTRKALLETFEGEMNLDAQSLGMPS